jgi:hypothetical protein
MNKAGLMITLLHPHRRGDEGWVPADLGKVRVRRKIPVASKPDSLKVSKSLVVGE